MSKILTTAFRAEKNKIESAGVIRLFKVYTTSPLYLAEYDKDIVFDTITYLATPMSSTDVSENITGTIDSMTVTIGNANRDMIAIIQGQSLLNVQVDVIEVFDNNLGDPNAYIKDVYYITNISVTEEAAIFTLDSLLMRVGIEIPRMTYSKGTCQWKYKSSQCGFEAGYANVTFTAPASGNTISWGSTTIGSTSINSGSAVYTTNRPQYIYYIEGNSTLGVKEDITLFVRNVSPKWILLCKYSGKDTITRYWSKTLDTGNYPSASSVSCDFTRIGINGCKAHNNGTRIGMFPGVGSGGRYSL